MNAKKEDMEVKARLASANSLSRIAFSFIKQEKKNSISSLLVVKS